MIEYQKITHEKVWQYLNQIVSYLTMEEIKTLNNLFELMGKDYTPIQSFGDAKLEFILKQETHPYHDTTMPCYFTPNGGNDIICNMLESFDIAKSHMELNELLLINSILPMMGYYQMTIHLLEEDGQFVLRMDSKKSKIL